MEERCRCYKRLRAHSGVGQDEASLTLGGCHSGAVEGGVEGEDGGEEAIRKGRPDVGAGRSERCKNVANVPRIFVSTNLHNCTLSDCVDVTFIYTTARAVSYSNGTF